MSGEAGAQAVLICRNLHDDLANFDRRASTIGTGGAKTPGTGVDSLFTLSDVTGVIPCVADRASGRACEPTFVRPAPPPPPLRAEWQADPIRLRLIALMRKHHCEPLEDYATGPFDAGAGPEARQPVVRAKN